MHGRGIDTTTFIRGWRSRVPGRGCDLAHGRRTLGGLGCPQMKIDWTFLIGWLVISLLLATFWIVMLSSLLAV